MESREYVKFFKGNESEEELQGWFFIDAYDQPVGPFSSEREARKALKKYADEL